jgi:hypothetical protein
MAVGTPTGFLRSVLPLWLLALAVSGALVASGQHWPQPLRVQPLLVWGLVLVPPGLMAVWLLVQWRTPGEGESLH